MNNFETRRIVMVDTQVRPSDVTKFPVIKAMLEVPREAYMPAEKRESAYVGADIEIAQNRWILAPRTLAKMLDALDIKPHEVVQDIGCGLGYSTAVIARMAETVVAIEEDETLARGAQSILSELSVDNAAVIKRSLSEGAKKHGPYDVIIIEGGVKRIPQMLVDQLKKGGRIATIFIENAVGTARIGYNLGGKISWRSVFNASAPLLPDFQEKAEFLL